MRNDLIFGISIGVAAIIGLICQPIIPIEITLFAGIGVAGIIVINKSKKK